MTPTRDYLVYEGTMAKQKKRPEKNARAYSVRGFKRVTSSYMSGKGGWLRRVRGGGPEQGET